MLACLRVATCTKGAGGAALAVVCEPLMRQDVWTEMVACWNKNYGCVPQASPEEFSAAARHDVVILAALMATMQNATVKAAWGVVLADPQRAPDHAGMAVVPDLPAGELCVPTGAHMPLAEVQAAFSAVMHAAGYPGCSAHGEGSSMWLVLCTGVVNFIMLYHGVGTCQH